MSGGGATIGQSLVDTGTRMGGKSPIQGRDMSMPAYGSQTTSPSPNHYTPTYTPIQQSPQQTVQNMGLQAIYQSMANQFAPISQQQNPMDRFYQGPMQQQQMPTYSNSALNYRPNMSGITANLNRVAPSVVLQQRQAAEEAARQAAENGGGGGD